MSPSNAQPDMNNWCATYGLQKPQSKNNSTVLQNKNTVKPEIVYFE